MNNNRAEAEIINRLFHRHRAGFRIDPSILWQTTPAYTLFKIEKDPAERVANLFPLQPEIEHAIYEHRGGDRHAFVRVSTQPLALEVNAVSPQKLHYGDVQWSAQPHTALCGMYYGVGAARPLLWEPSSPKQPHVLIAGTTGSGKTTLVQSVVLSLCRATPPDEVQFSFIDFKNSPALRTLAKLPHVTGMATEEGEALDAIRSFHDEIIRRKNADGAHVRRVLVIDELAEFTASTDRGYREETTSLLHSIVRLGREFRMHLICCTQKPTAKVIGEQLKANLPVRLVGMVTSPEDSKTATGIAAAGAHRLPGEGAFVHVNGGIIQRIQAPFVEDVLREVRVVRALHHLAPNMVVRSEAQPVDRAQQPMRSESIKSIPSALVDVCEAYGYAGGDYPRGFVNAALSALNGGEVPAGATFQRLRKSLDAYLLTYLPQKDPKIIRFPRPHVAA